MLLEQAQPFGGRLSPNHVLEPARELIAMRAPRPIGGEALVSKLRRELDEVLPEVLLQDAERQALAIGGLEDVVHRKEMRARIGVALEAMAHGAEEERRLDEGQIEISALALAHGSENGDGGEGAPCHVGDGERRARRRL